MGNRAAYEVFDRVGAAHARGSMAATDFYDWGGPKIRERIEVFDYRRRVWVRPDRETVRRLNKLSAAQLKAMLRNMQFGFRLAPEFDDEPALDAKLDAAMDLGRLDLGGRSYKLAVSPTGNVRVTGAFGTVSHTRGALLDVIQRGHF